MRKRKISKWREAVNAYERMLIDYPEHTGAQHNLDYARYHLKQLLQQPESEENDEEKQEKEDEDKPQIITLFQSANTEIPGAQAVSTENTVQLVRPRGNKNGAPK